MGRVEGKVAIVTGGGSGLGRADALMLAKEGAKVVVTDIDERKGQAVADEIGAAAIFLKQDVALEADWLKVVSETENKFGHIDVLVNNAGVVVMATIDDTTTEQWHHVNRIMSDGVFFGCKHVLPALRRNGGGSIINMSSTASHLGYPIFFAYSAAKGAVRSMTKSIAAHCLAEGDKVRCNSIHAGGIDTPMIRLAMGIALDDPNPVPGVGTPDDIAYLVVYLASDESRFITGSEIVIDNGTIIRPAA